MGRELQKKKRRSGAQPVRRPRSLQAQKKVLHNPLIRANWNKKETLAQNYKRLGLVSKLNRRAGGVQRMGQDADKVDGQPNPFAIGRKGGVAVSSGGGVGKGELEEVVISRDAETGEVTVVGENASANPLQDSLNALEDNDEEAEAEDEKEWAGVMGYVGKESKVQQTDVTKALEQLAKSGVRKKPRHQSEREEEWLAKLVEKHGHDYEAMFRDRKLNVMQQSQGDLKKRVKKWHARQKPAEGD